MLGPITRSSLRHTNIISFFAARWNKNIISIIEDNGLWINPSGGTVIPVSFGPFLCTVSRTITHHSSWSSEAIDELLPYKNLSYFLVVVCKIICEGTGTENRTRKYIYLRTRNEQLKKGDTKSAEIRFLKPFLSFYLNGGSCFSRGTFVIWSHNFLIPLSFQSLKYTPPWICCMVIVQEIILSKSIISTGSISDKKA